jgi:hypothetical protein
MKRVVLLKTEIGELVMVHLDHWVAVLTNSIGAGHGNVMYGFALIRVNSLIV